LPIRADGGRIIGWEENLHPKAQAFAAGARKLATISDELGRLYTEKAELLRELLEYPQSHEHRNSSKIDEINRLIAELLERERLCYDQLLVDIGINLTESSGDDPAPPRRGRRGPRRQKADRLAAIMRQKLEDAAVSKAQLQKMTIKEVRRAFSLADDEPSGPTISLARKIALATCSF
jgi:hypothetical protein